MKIGYQLYSAAKLCQGKENLKSTIRKIAAMGYDGIEFISYEGMSSDEMKEFLAECGVEGFNSHVQLERWEADAEGEVRYAAEVGIPYVTIPWMAPELRNSTGYEKVRAMIPEIMEYCKRYGVKLLYHNHDFEFEKEGGAYILDVLLDTDAELGLELDTFWVHYAGLDPVAYMAAQKEKLTLIHVKDYESFTGGGVVRGCDRPAFTAIGTGMMDNQAIIDYAKEIGIAWAVVEQDNSKIDVLESAEISVRTLREYLKD